MRGFHGGSAIEEVILARITLKTRRDFGGTGRCQRFFQEVSEMSNLESDEQNGCS